MGGRRDRAISSRPPPARPGFHGQRQREGGADRRYAADVDTMPLHHDIATDIVTIAAGSGLRPGDYLTAIPYNRSMYRTTLVLRLSAIVDSVIILGVLGSQNATVSGGDTINWAFGSPMACLSILWSAADVVGLLVRDRGVRWAKSDPAKLPRSTRFSWGGPGWHVAAHLIIWLTTLVCMGIVIWRWLDDRNLYFIGVDVPLVRLGGALIFFMFILISIHFALFVFACVEVDNQRRQDSDVVTVPNGELGELVPVPPATAMEIFVPRKLQLSYFASHYVRFVPGADGTVTMARDYSSRQARS